MNLTQVAEILQNAGLTVTESGTWIIISHKKKPLRFWDVDRLLDNPQNLCYIHISGGKVGIAIADNQPMHP